MKSGLNAIPIDVNYPFYGLDVLAPSTMLQTNLSPAAVNMAVTKGILQKRKGAVTLGATLTDPVMLLTEFQTLAGTRYLVACTTKKQYYLNAGAWTNITKNTGADVNLSGDETNMIDYTIMIGTEGKYIIITNGIEKPRWWNGTGLFTDVPFTDGTFVTCKTLATFSGSLVMGNVTYGGPNPQTITWSDTNTISALLGGNSGTATVTDAQGDILRILPLGDRLAIYSRDSIGVATFVGGTQLFSFEQLVQDSRLVSARGIVNLGPWHVYMGQENIMLFDGTRQLRTLGDKIHKNYRDQLSTDYKERAYMFLDKARNQVYLNIPLTSSQSVQYMFEYNTFDITDLKWWLQYLTFRPTCMGFFTRSSTELWNDTANNAAWNTDAAVWVQGSSAQGFPMRLAGSNVGQVYQFDDSSFQDGTSPVPSNWASKDFSADKDYESIQSRWMEVEFEAMGDAVDVAYSTDKGASYTTIQTNLALTGDWTKYKLFVDVVSNTFRLLFSNGYSNSGIQIRWIRVWHRPHSV